MSSDLRLVVGGRSYGGWKAIRVTRSIEALVGSFSLEVSDRWADQDVAWPIAEEDSCRVLIDGTTVIDGFVDRRSVSIAADSRSLSYDGRDRAAALVDCSADLDRWTFRKVTALDVARKVAEPFGIAVSLQPGLALPKPMPKVVFSPGDSPLAVIERVAQPSGVLAVSDGAGGIVLTRAGAGRAAALREGVNVLAASVDYDATDRFHRYSVVTQVAGTDEASGAATRVRAEALDEGVRREDRALLIRPESGVTTDYARRRADWEARIRAARAEVVSVVVQGWKQPDGRLWPINALSRVTIPGVGMDGDLLISQVDFTIGSGGEVTQLRLVRPDAYAPEPTAVVKRPRAKQPAGGFANIRDGATLPGAGGG